MRESLMSRTPAQIAASLAAIGLAAMPMEAPKMSDRALLNAYGTKIKVEKGHRSIRDVRKRNKRKIANASKRRNRK